MPIFIGNLGYELDTDQAYRECFEVELLRP